MDSSAVFTLRIRIALEGICIFSALLIIAAENFTIFPFEKRYWPEFLGVGVLIFILVLMTTANWRLMFNFAYDKWLRFHRLGTLVAIALIIIHILFVSETFKSGLPRTLVFVATGINLMLIWSNKTKEHIVFPVEFKSLEHRLQHLHIIHVITRDSGGEYEIGRLDQTRLEKLLKGWRRKSNVFICGPFEMMKEMNRAVKKIGFSSARVYKEEFRL